MSATNTVTSDSQNGKGAERHAIAVCSNALAELERSTGARINVVRYLAERFEIDIQDTDQHGQAEAMMPHPAVWAHAHKVHGEANDSVIYHRLPDSAKRAIEVLGLLLDIHNWNKAEY